MEGEERGGEKGDGGWGKEMSSGGRMVYVKS